MRRAIALLVVSVAIVSFAGSTLAVGRAVPAAALAGATGSEGMCALLPARDVKAAARERMDVVTDAPDFCSYGGRTPGGGTPTTIVLVKNPGAVDEGPLIDQARALRPDATDVDVDGVPALLEKPDRVLDMRDASIHLFPDDETWYEISALLPKRVNIGAALTRLAAAVVARLGTIAPPSPSPVPSPTITSLCLILAADEVSTAYGGAPITVVADQPTNCVYSAEEAGDPDTGLVATLAPPVPEGVSAIELARAQFPDAVEVQVAGVPALYVAGALADLSGIQPGGTLHVFPDDSTWLLLEGSAPATVDLQAALTALAELAVPRLIALLAAPAPSLSPAPSFVAGGDLQSLFPTEIGGGPVNIQKLTLDSAGGFLSGAQAKAFERVTKLLRDRGMKPRDAAMWVGVTASGAGIIAIQVEGADIAPFVQPLMTVLSVTPSDAALPEALEGRGVTVFEQSGLPAFLYPKGDIMWLVLGQADAVTEIFDVLP